MVAKAKESSIIYNRREGVASYVSRSLLKEVKE